ncbi:putative Na+/H+ antiporter [Brachymonas denitrificans]|uniref:Na+/H+ antiporter NhaD n=1 Tax=Brachymonas denitrificans DSM 15123 TaxID=1121117 RepID=A0A1H8EEL1_9BURK|nr:putative Na+/H+ antiporter [Brachymonas denitrificans]SEN17277.1 Na+/H+ antiporter NhaD [Brachymonas denitrificans DSM 15123]
MSPNFPHAAELLAATLFALALIHTFSTKYFHGLAQRYPGHSGVWHLLGEVEVVFGFWAMLLMVLLFGLYGQDQALGYLESRNFTEPMFVFVIMVVAATRPILDFASRIVLRMARLLPLPDGMALYFMLLAFVPLLGSFITEPAAMTLAALMLRDAVFTQPVTNRLKYGTLGVLFVNVSIGGVLTPFAAPPVLMVAAKWGWDLPFMLTQFGWKAAVAVCFNAGAAMWLLRRELKRLPVAQPEPGSHVPVTVVVIHLLFLATVVLFAHHPVVFMGMFLFFLGYTAAYPRNQSPLILREALLVAFFLAGLVVLGGMQQWWLQPLLMGLNADTVYFAATALTAITDNAALTYLASLVEGLSPDFKTALVAGAVTGGGLTLIANAPNPAGATILKEHFPEGAIHFFWLLVAALPPTLVAMMAFRLL